MSKKILVLPGDGIGPEIVAEAVKVLANLRDAYDLDIDLDEALVGGAAIDATGGPLPDATLELAKEADAILLGAVGGPKWEPLDISMSREGAAGAALGAQPVRQSASGNSLSAAGRSLQPEIGDRGRSRYHDRARADRRHLLRPAPGYP